MLNECKISPDSVLAVRPMIAAKDFMLSRQFYEDVGFQARPLTVSLVEMRLGLCTFILQDYYVKDWADNCVIHLTVSDLNAWWQHIQSLDLSSRYQVTTSPPYQEGWPTVAGFTDPSGVLWRLAELTT